MNSLLDPKELCYKVLKFHLYKIMLYCFPKIVILIYKLMVAIQSFQSHQYLVLTDFLTSATLVVIKCFFTHILNCISRIINEVNYVLIYVLAICVSSL